MNRENLQKLATFLAYGELPKEVQFTMARFADNSHIGNGTTCGSVGCAIGFAPFAGFQKHSGETWTRYSWRLFVEDSKEWAWCFDEAWEDVDNTPIGAAQRIQYLLDNGLPELWEHSFESEDECVHLYTDTVVKK